MDRDGYGTLSHRFGDKRRILRAHRVAMFLHTGRWSELHVLHTCDIRGCVNPAHLYEGTDHDNLMDAIERSGVGVISESDVPVIRARYLAGKVCREIAQDLGVSTATVYGVVTGRTWRWAHDGSNLSRGYSRRPVEARILAALAAGHSRIQEIADVAGTGYKSASALLARMVSEGVAVRVGRGLYGSV